MTLNLSVFSTPLSAYVLVTSKVLPEVCRFLAGILLLSAPSGAASASS